LLPLRTTSQSPKAARSTLYKRERGGERKKEREREVEEKEKGEKGRRRRRGGEGKYITTQPQRQ